MPIQYVAGQGLTADDLNARLPIRAIKTASLGRASTAVLADDPDLTVTLRANIKYRINANLGASGATAADIQIAYRLTGTVVQEAAATGREFVGMPIAVTDVLTTTMRIQKSSSAASITTPASYGIEPTAGVIREEFHVDGGASGGTLTLQWAQAVSNVTQTVLTGSLTATPVV